MSEEGDLGFETVPQAQTDYEEHDVMFDTITQSVKYKMLAMKNILPERGNSTDDQCNAALAGVMIGLRKHTASRRIFACLLKAVRMNDNKPLGMQLFLTMEQALLLGSDDRESMTEDQFIEQNVVMPLDMLIKTTDCEQASTPPPVSVCVQILLGHADVAWQRTLFIFGSTDIAGQQTAENKEQMMQAAMAEEIHASVRLCKKCGSNGLSLLRCSRCKAVHYCNKECQVAHWPMHKKLCVTP